MYLVNSEANNKIDFEVVKDFIDMNGLENDLLKWFNDGEENKVNKMSEIDEKSIREFAFDDISYFSDWLRHYDNDTFRKWLKSYDEEEYIDYLYNHDEEAYKDEYGREWKREKLELEREFWA